MSKSAPKTMRFDSEVEDYINKFQGDDFSKRFHSMVYYFITLEDEKKVRISMLDAKIKNMEQRVRDLSDLLNDTDWLDRHFRDLTRSFDSVRGYLDHFVSKNM